MKINPRDPAYPNPGVPGIYRDCPGLPIRLELAARMAQGLCGATTAQYERGPCNSAIVARAFVLADALIAAYNEGQE